MFCKSCGAKLEDGEQFCTNCGEKNEYKKTKKYKHKKSKKPKNKLLRFLTVFAILILLLSVVFWGLVHFSISPFYIWYYNAVEFFNKDKRETVEYNMEDYVENADDYYGEKSEIISVTPVSKSKNILSEKEFAEDITELGFADENTYSFYKYDMDGTIYVDDNEVSSNSDEKHPVLEAYTYLDDDSVWHIYELDGEIMAYPVSYLSKNKCKIPIVISESDEIVSYDSINQSFYRTIPKSDEVIVIVVDKITADSLKKINISAEEAK